MDTNTDRSIESLLNLAPVDFQAFADAMTEHQQGALSRQLETTILGLTRLSAYLDRRSLGGTHEQAVKKSNATVNTVRKALGYTYDLHPLSY